MKNMTRIFAVCTLGLGMAACGTGSAENAKNFNPVRDTLDTNGLLETVKASDEIQKMCEITAPLMARFNEMGADAAGLMGTFNQPYHGYLCNAAGAPGYETLFFNDGIANPPAGKTADQVRAGLKEKALEQAYKSCDDLKYPSGKVFIHQPGERTPGMCRAYGHP